MKAKNRLRRSGFCVIILFYEKLSNLNGVCSRAFSYLVAAAEERNAVICREVFADTSNENEVLVCRVERHGVNLCFGSVCELTALCIRNSRAYSFNRELIPREHGNGDGVGAHYGYAHASASNVKLGEVHNLSALVLHLHFFGCVEVIAKTADLRDKVSCNLVGECFILNNSFYI